jgi:hypothetical protein
LRKNGTWLLNLRADQNPDADGEGPQAATADGKFTQHLKRNLFVVKLRFHGSLVDGDTADDPTSGKAVLGELRPIEFWVQRGRREKVSRCGHSPWVTEYFNLINRTELEFYYR